MEQPVYNRIHHTVRHAKTEDRRLQVGTVIGHIAADAVTVRVQEHKRHHHHVVRTPADDERGHNDHGYAQRFDFRPMNELLPLVRLRLVHAVEIVRGGRRAGSLRWQLAAGHCGRRWRLCSYVGLLEHALTGCDEVDRGDGEVGIE